MRSIASLCFAVVLAATLTSAAAASESVVVKVCNDTASGNYVCTGSCRYYSVPVGGCLTDPTDSWMSLSFKCSMNARCFSATAFRQAGCTGDRLTNNQLLCGACGGGTGITCTPGGATSLENCTSRDTCVTGCDVVFDAPLGQCTSVPGNGGMSVRVNSFSPCAAVEWTSYHGGANNCSAGVKENSNWVPSGSCARFNIDNEGTFGYAFECAAWGTAVEGVRPFSELSRAGREALLRAIRRDRAGPRLGF
uniref:Leishmanolysin-like peptidase n=1 Tax=Neobodo designis TaxID=312471 RepID=A0A7S1LRY3_NEODS|mmetsp:Transcript_27265/g.84476  ORF Transcript_27265/g.84476 Transcript_27265/m.84476 type:complete len:250 (+) Transcript_27265:42-791(+)